MIVLCSSDQLTCLLSSGGNFSKLTRFVHKTVILKVLPCKVCLVSVGAGFTGAVKLGGAEVVVSGPERGSVT